MLDTFYPGETIRLMAKDLTHTADGSVTGGAAVSVLLANPDGSTFFTGTAATGGSGDDWYLDVAAPDDPGTYEVKITATKSGATWKGKDTIRVVAF